LKVEYDEAGYRVLKMDSRPLIALLPVGGAGTRLWPVSNNSHPKQFLKVFADRSLVQATLTRVDDAGVDGIVMVTGQDQAALLKEQVAELAFSHVRLLLEPCRRDSAAAIAAGVAWIRQTIAQNAVIAVLPADHFIPDQAKFTSFLRQAAALASEGWLVTLGIRPTAPTSEYGYIQRDTQLAVPGIDLAYKVARFHEKPSRVVAEAYLRDGNYDWNSGIFVFSVETFVTEATRHMPDVWEAVQHAVANGRPGEDTFSFDERAFASARKSSIDYLLFEKSDRVAIIPVDFAWHDIGNWSSAYDAFHSHNAGNVVSGDVVLDDVSGSIVIADKVKVIVSGLRDVVVACSKEGTFVASRSNAPAIKRLLEM
jgi:mannose-1-phosphate guanylyltransferase/mannose-6-phosphate isomerase